jgi:hypothetical protein
MFSEFSRGYYLGRLYVEPREDERAAMHRGLHQQVNEQLHADEGVARLDRPLVLKLGNRHIAVHGEAGVPEGTLAVPEHLVADADVRNPPTLKEVLLAKADRARQLLRLSGQLDDPPGDDDPDPQVGI